ncbi:hypothetical protein QAD02_020213 [Eretmocerus hayati]|uniref:Uncharacterized protein n=1 Tax=Eretmocerus hayati TaxID=131215 RepID=A0ACC2PN11_9HYME|nr:hypothetical protein QAD02_020213 [Eretmocerus hayati]
MLCMASGSARLRDMYFKEAIVCPRVRGAAPPIQEKRGESEEQWSQAGRTGYEKRSSHCASDEALVGGEERGPMGSCSGSVLALARCPRGIKMKNGRVKDGTVRGLAGREPAMPQSMPSSSATRLPSSRSPVN